MGLKMFKQKEFTKLQTMKITQLIRIDQGIGVP